MEELHAQLVETRAQMVQYREVLDELIDALLMCRDQQITPMEFMAQVVDVLDNYA